MQQSDDRNQGPRRPSLFTEEPAAPAEDRGILSQLDGKAAAPVRASSGSRNTGKIVGGVLGLGVIAGGLVWAFDYSDDDFRPVTPQVATRAPAVQPAPAPVLAVATPSTTVQTAELPLAGKIGAADEHEVSAATILDTTTAGDHPNQPNDELTRSLSRSLEGSAKTGSKDELTAAFDRSTDAGKHEQASVHGAKTHDKPAARDKEKDRDKDRRKAERKAEAARKERAEAARVAKKRAGHGGAASTDSDATLLEALMSRLHPAGKSKGAKKAAPAAHCAPEGAEDSAQHTADCKANG